MIETKNLSSLPTGEEDKDRSLIDSFCDKKEKLPINLPLVLASQNRIKQDIFLKFAPTGSSNISVLFDELTIKQELKERGINPQRDGFNYLVNISREKLKIQRQKRNEVDLKSDEQIIVSDSVVMVEEEAGVFTAIDRDNISLEEENRILDSVNKKRELVFVGAISFGRKKGQSNFTVLTYLKVPLQKELKFRPKENLLSDLPQIVDTDKEFEVGYIDCQLKDNGDFLPEFKKHTSSLDVESIVGYIPGLTPETIHLAKGAGEFDTISAELLESVMTRYPFNTLSQYLFYRRLRKNDDRGLFYQDLLNNFNYHFEQRGGDCFMQCLKIYSEMEAIIPNSRIVLFPTIFEPYNYDFGHSGILTNYDSQNFLIDLGLSIPYAIPVTEIPLVPFQVGRKKVSVIAKPNMVDRFSMILHTKDRLIKMPATAMLSIGQFRQNLPDYFFNHMNVLLSARKPVKIEFFDNSGNTSLYVGFDTDTLRLQIRYEGENYENMISSFLEDATTREKLGKFCANKNINFPMIMSELKSLVG